MDFNQINKMLGKEIPNMLKTIKGWERSIDPFLGKITELKQHMTTEQRNKIQELQEEIAKQKQKINDLNI